MSATATMEKPTFDRIRNIVYQTSGIALGQSKGALVSARVGKRMRVLGIPSFAAYLGYLDDNPGEVVGLLDAVSTNVTSFFRESEHFDYIAEHFSRLYAQGQRRFRVWSAACSTGEEPYSLAMVLADALPYPDIDLRILATDISTRALTVAEDGTYPERHMQPVPGGLRRAWFTPVQGAEGDAWCVKPQLRRRILFRRMNLSAPPFPMRGPLDAVFCRNVMIYFDDAVRGQLLAECNRLLAPGGLLFVGHAESLAGMIGDFSYVRPSVYRRT